jgi:hypothetical protein
MDSEVRLRTKPYDKRDYFNFSILNLIFIYVVTFDQVVPVCEEYIPHLKWSDMPKESANRVDIIHKVNINTILSNVACFRNSIV